jgi:hypothetical protein
MALERQILRIVFVVCTGLGFRQATASATSVLCGEDNAAAKD